MKKILLFLLLVFASGILTVNAQNKSIYFNKGYRADIQIGTVIDNTMLYSVTTSHGHSFGNGLYLGGGTGLYFGNSNFKENKFRVSIPVFAEIKYSFLNKLASPFIGAKGGGFFDYTDSGCGYIIRPYIGVDIWRFSVSVGWDHTRCIYGGYDNSKTRVGNSGISIGLSYNF